MNTPIYPIARFCIGTLAALFISITSTSQTEIDRQLQMTGTTNTERLITGVGNPEAADHAVNASTVQNGSLVYAVATGSVNAYVVSFSPAITAYTNGMMVSFRANASNTGACTLDLGPGVRSIRKQVSSQLVANDILNNQIVTVIYDGTNFQMLSAVSNTGGGLTACPSGFINVNNNFCIEQNERTATTWINAYNTCSGLGPRVRLCDQVDFYAACTQAGALGLSNMTNNDEWAWGQNNSNPGMNTAGTNGSCGAINWRNITDNRTYRCCFYR